MRILTIALIFIIPVSLYAAARSNSSGLAERVAELEAQVEELVAAQQEAQEILQFVRVEPEEMDGVIGPNWIIEGANVHVRSGSGYTNDGCGSNDPDFPNCEVLTGLGNLVVGYNEIKPGGKISRAIRTGSHNLVVGEFHSYSSFAGFVAGRANLVLSSNASVCGGSSNVAIGNVSSICGGNGNVASGFGSSVSGGRLREVPDDFNWAAGELFQPN